MPRRRGKYDQRSMFVMAPVERAAEQLRQLESRQRYQAARYHRVATDYDIIWWQGSQQHDTDDHLTDIVAQAVCLADIRGNDYIGRAISQHLYTIVSVPTEGTAESYHHHDYSDIELAQIQRELAGLE